MTLEGARSLRAAAMAVALCIATAGTAAAQEETPPPDGTPVEPASAGPAPSPAAGEMLTSMREKGLLTEEEYEELYRRQARYEAEREARDGLPGWARNWTFGGDMRLRYERRDFGSLGFDEEYSLGNDNIIVGIDDPRAGEGLGVQDRFRLRLRLGAEKLLTDDFTFGFRLATSMETEYGTFFGAGGVTDYSQTLTSDPRSENFDFGQLFASADIFVDRAYLRWQPSFARTLSVSVGKFGNPFVSEYWDSDFLVWDNDIQPEGIAAGYRFDFSEDRFWFDGNIAALWVNEVATITLDFDPTDGTATARQPDLDDKDAYLWGVQGGLHGRPAEWVQLGGRVSYYDFAHIGSRTAAALLDFGNTGNAIDNNPLFQLLDSNDPDRTDGSADGQIRELVLDGYATFTPWGERYAITPFVQWTTLLTASKEDNGLAIGFDFGTPELAKLTVMWARIERNGTISVFTDSDMFEGFTNAKGWYVALERQIVDGIRVRGAFFRSHQLESECQEGRGDDFCDTAVQLSNLGYFRETTLDRYRWQLDLLVDF